MERDVVEIAKGRVRRMGGRERKQGREGGGRKKEEG
jgi:hypothetical protein